jgi:hypothetical protein
MASVTYPSGRVLSYGYSNAARQVSVVDSANSINYATGATYAPQGALAGMARKQWQGTCLRLPVREAGRGFGRQVSDK